MPKKLRPKKYDFSERSPEMNSFENCASKHYTHETLFFEEQIESIFLTLVKNTKNERARADEEYDETNERIRKQSESKGFVVVVDVDSNVLVTVVRFTKYRALGTRGLRRRDRRRKVRRLGLYIVTRYLLGLGQCILS